MVSAYKWHLHISKKANYARCDKGVRGARIRIYLHRFIMGAGEDQIVDHKDNDGLNCQRYNLRVTTVDKNNKNRRSFIGSSRYKGVSWNKRLSKWIARIANNGKDIYLGAFEDETEAAIAYDRAATERHGEYANLNFPGDGGEQEFVPF
jgi:hypothetical protein